MESTQLSDLRTEARLLADERLTGYVTDSELTRFINLKLRSIRAWILSLPGARRIFCRTEEFPLVAAQAVYSLGSGTSSVTASAAEHFHELSVQWATDRYENIEPVQERVLDALKSYTWGERVPKGLLIGANDDGLTVTLAPTPTAASTCRLTYQPAFVPLSVDTSLLVGPAGLRECVTIESARLMLGMQGKPSAYLDEPLALARESIKRDLRLIHARYAPLVQDVRPDSRMSDNPWYFPLE